ncbi:S1-like domain-containing RNA-binding protein [Leuconostoc falkenbergense]|uniref:S1-like domain-containing RNA-binding protein n=1 Tax=Leuconostoc falkenbergense TaxID=2766470 RepID=A0ABT7S0J0_9LACO|nr:MULTISPECIES: S1-like domain-containing RNA-binding protein [Leuconostoc]MDM7647070.1 S1-like domain-containing RNA-binding protein [Leuconostoc falkenbergense]MDY5164215.1 S1-like domain-containing RNA-binding protein [Leuconostoc falkenbergense]NLT84759.1 RNA-binding protein [Leuconostoc sp.]HCU42077.1 RNA-binding protein [Leuconostoc pseudomesenteroides]
MNPTVGTTIKAQVTDENSQFFFAQVDGFTYEIDKSELQKPLKLGGFVTGFAYKNEDHKLQITKNVPTAQKDVYGWGTVVANRHDLGVFVAIGLPNKDIVVSLDDLPTITSLWPQKGDRLMIAIKEDSKGRLWGEIAQQNIINAVSRRAPQEMKSKQIKATVYRNKMAGTLVLTEDYYLGFIHPSQRDDEPRLGEIVNARVIGVRDDGTLNLSLKPLAYKTMNEDATFLLLQLQRRSDHFLPFNDKSNPEAIKRQFGFSKSQFKRALGHLYKERLIEQVDGGIKLVEQ